MEFWNMLGGKREYAQGGYLLQRPPLVKLFMCKSSPGSFQVDVVYHWGQHNLQEDAIVILDVYFEVFVWIGQNITAQDVAIAQKVAQKYLAKINDGRNSSCPISIIKAGEEPSLFKCHFFPWKELVTATEDHYDKLKKEKELTAKPQHTPVMTELLEASKNMATKITSKQKDASIEEQKRKEIVAQEKQNQEKAKQEEQRRRSLSVQVKPDSSEKKNKMEALKALRNQRTSSIG
jgi:hypothetical protein